MLSLKRKIVYAALTIISACICVIIFLFTKGFFRGFTGDAVIVMLIYFFLMIFYRFNPYILAAMIFIFSFSIEIIQYFKLFAGTGLEKSLLIRITIGSVFDPKDLIAYASGLAAVLIIDKCLIGLLIEKKTPQK